MKMLGKMFLLIIMSMLIQRVEIAQNINNKIMYLKKDSVISDGQKGIFFRYPVDFQVDNNGSLYFNDASRLLKFDKNGKFELNFLRRGMGPGEVINRYCYILHSNIVSVLHSFPQKIIVFENNGKFIKEIRFENRERLKLLGYYNGQYFFIGS